MHSHGPEAHCRSVLRDSTQAFRDGDDGRDAADNDSQLTRGAAAYTVGPGAMNSPLARSTNPFEGAGDRPSNNPYEGKSAASNNPFDDLDEFGTRSGKQQAWGE